MTLEELKRLMAKGNGTPGMQDSSGKTADTSSIENEPAAPAEVAERLHELGPIIEKDYRKLCRQVGLAERVPLDPYIIVPNSSDKSEYGADLSYPYPGYDQKAIHLPFHWVEALDFQPVEPSFPPTHWHLLHAEWPSWRVNLWHETIHQYDDQVLHTWNPTDAHGASWSNATRIFATKFNKATEDIEAITRGAVAPVSAHENGPTLRSENGPTRLMR
jgi:hypothetical protein